MTNQSGEQTAEQPLDVLAEQYPAQLKRLNYGRATINVYLRTIHRLADYIRQDRVSTSRALFVSVRAPHGPFKDGTVLNTILKAAFTRTGVRPPCRYVGSHVLRHSLATNLVRQGASLPEVGDMLRHRSRASTLIYAKLDIEGLRSIAQPWPLVEGAQ